MHDTPLIGPYNPDDVLAWEQGGPRTARQFLADVSRLVAHDDQRREAEAPATLDDFGHAVDVNHAFLEFFFVELLECHDFKSSETQAGFAGCVGERLDAPVVEIAATVEDDAGDAGLLRPGGEQLAHSGGLLGLRAFE